MDKRYEAQVSYIGDNARAIKQMAQSFPEWKYVQGLCNAIGYDCLMVMKGDNPRQLLLAIDMLLLSCRVAKVESDRSRVMLVMYDSRAGVDSLSGDIK